MCVRLLSCVILCVRLLSYMRKKLEKCLFGTKPSCFQICNYDRVNGHTQKHLPRPLKHSQNVTVRLGKGSFLFKMTFVGDNVVGSHFVTSWHPIFQINK